MHSTHTKVNITKAKCSSNGNPSLKPSLIDHAKALPVITGAKALDNEAAVIASPLTEPNMSVVTELLAKIAVELKAQPVLNFIGRRIPINKGQRIVDLL